MIVDIGGLSHTHQPSRSVHCLWPMRGWVHHHCSRHWHDGPNSSFGSPIFMMTASSSESMSLTLFIKLFSQHCWCEGWSIVKLALLDNDSLIFCLVFASTACLHCFFFSEMMLEFNDNMSRFRINEDTSTTQWLCCLSLMLACSRLQSCDQAPLKVLPQVFHTKWVTNTHSPGSSFSAESTPSRSRADARTDPGLPLASLQSKLASGAVWHILIWHIGCSLVKSLHCLCGSQCPSSKWELCCSESNVSQSVMPTKQFLLRST